MKLRKVALITLSVLLIGFIGKLIINFSFVSHFPIKYLFNSIESIALIFFFYMLYKNAGDK